MTEQSNPHQPQDNDNPEDRPDIPDDVADLVGAQRFDIGEYRVDDFREAAHRSAGKRITFPCGKPGNLRRGVPILTRKDVQLRANLVPRRLGKQVRFALPTVEFREPELAIYLEPIHLLPVIDVTRSTPVGLLWPFRITVWDGYERVFAALAALNDAVEGLYLRYEGGEGSDPGTYTAQRFPMEKKHREIWSAAPWPQSQEVLTLVPSVPFEELLAEDFTLRRAWEAAEQRLEASR